MLAGMFQALADDFAEKLQPIADQCAGKQAPQASGFADTLLSIVEGSIILAKAHRDPTRIPKGHPRISTLIGDPNRHPRVGRPHAIGQAHSEAFEICKGTRTRILSVESGIQK